MRCLLCHYQHILFVNSKKQSKKSLPTYYKTSGITCLQKHLDVDHLSIYKRFQEYMNNEGKENVKRQSANKRSNISNYFVFEFFCFKISFKKGWCGTKDVCGKSCIFNNEKSFAFAICGKRVVKVFNVTIMSSCVSLFLKIIFKHCFAWINRNN